RVDESVGARSAVVVSGAEAAGVMAFRSGCATLSRSRAAASATLSISDTCQRLASRSVTASSRAFSELSLSDIGDPLSSDAVHETGRGCTDRGVAFGSRRHRRFLRALASWSRGSEQSDAEGERADDERDGTDVRDIDEAGWAVGVRACDREK